MRIIVIADRRDGSIRPVTRELAAKAASLGESLVVEVTGLDHYEAGPTVDALAAFVERESPDLILTGATPHGRDIAARLAARLGRPFLGQCSDVRIKDGSLFGVRLMYAGKVLATVRTSLPAIATVRSNAFPIDGPSAELELVEIPADGTDSRLRFERFEPTTTTGRGSIADARIIVAGGRGVNGAENWWLVDALADALGGATGASRGAVDPGWRPHEEQVGQTGKFVAPDLYVALGISGAVQHLAGMSASRVIVAINKDPSADIFKSCDYGVVGDMFDVVPPLIESINRVKAS